MNPVLTRKLEAFGLNAGQIQSLESAGVQGAEDIRHLTREQIEKATGCTPVAASKIVTYFAKAVAPEEEEVRKPLKPKILIAAILIAFGVVVAASYILHLRAWENILLAVGVAILVIWYFFGIKRSLVWVIETFELIFVGALFAWPIVIFAICSMIDVFHQRFQIPPQDDVKNWMLVMVFTSFLLAFISIEASYYLRKKWMIVGNMLTALLWCVVIALVTGYNLHSRGLEWWTFLPFMASAIEAAGGIFAGVQNAWNKNPAQIERDS